MKPIEKLINTNVIGGVKIYLDDLELILYKLHQSGFNTIISDDDNMYDSIDELKQFKGNNPKIIKIEAHNNDLPLEYIYIRIVDNVSSVLSNGKNVLAASYEIEKILANRKNKFIYTYFINPKNALINLILISSIALFAFIYKSIYLKQQYNKIEWLGIILIWSIIYLYTLLNPNTNEKIELERKHEDNFFKKNKSAILVGIIIAIITAIITLIIDYIKK
ncbi:hypothetical protein FSS13T_18610 [Flavobacterium saliperosum S13]|uniref:Uncharacterized protein n=2 Tax=Flavobacterium saliperosum TaxID=329186 RepID=A0A1G4W9M6_9FLAO|nr:hypothetical protein [Flavobacterium saliperosum]ESU25068.1 hypothetical protein FSS13T_18610 [Flavobacterium saliperosum S13]SCX19041.1 hypothetical protein SAMN02927925_02766 [Flavobacterium saliperosum]